MMKKDVMVKYFKQRHGCWHGLCFILTGLLLEPEKISNLPHESSTLRNVSKMKSLKMCFSETVFSLHINSQKSH